ncbi:PQQ-dependent sugar dehydrogenase [Paracoccus aestuarii]|uniref:PQQ-dependent sugar dehydrogenase n=1 Tax=Paracoccus aestuarii TaxID=453842 RepID=A0A418ZWD8_9RHOB|nr:PQQ-dependent sugar dehydrogenase [Paracoccus aestuarii]RJL04802.1 PQQ-dependent sugar dehydrogenase [Paracoccus aestuarii]WCQ99381.1 PQQ-dependent sugar dehydrogenase [Paracoccus aestuarii]
MTRRIRRTTTSLTALAATGFLASMAVAQDWNEEPPHGAAYDQTPAFEGQTRAPALESGNVDLEQTVVLDELEHPWGLVQMPDGDWLLTERPGRMRIVTNDGEMSDPIEGIPEVDARDQGGLHDVSIASDFDETRRVWWTYAEPRGDGENATAVATGILSEDGSTMEEVNVIWQQQPAWASTKHFGARIVHDGEGHIFVGLGERSDPEPRVYAQDPQSTLGKIIRINAEDGSPAGSGIDGALPEIWSMGHRNIQGAAMSPDGQLWMNEHGPRGGDELNLIEPGLNYGWPEATYGTEYNGDELGQTEVEGTQQPNYYWDPSPAISGMAFYEGDMFPEWQGHALIGGLRSGDIIRLQLEDGMVVGEARHAEGIGRVREIEVAQDGSLMVITDHENGQLIRITPEG